jgi:gliding motility-associated-like protein
MSFRIIIVFFCFIICSYAIGQKNLYSIKVVWSPNERYLARIDVKNGEVENISKSSVFEWYQTDGGTTIDPNTGNYYVRSTDNNNVQKLYGIDLFTGEINSSPILSNHDDLHQMNFNPMDSTLYAIKVVWSPNERYLVKIDPVTGVVTQLSSSSIFEWYQTDGGSTIDPVSNTFYIRSEDKQNNQRLYGIDLKTGNIKTQPIMSNSDDLHQMVFNCLDSTLYAIKVVWNPNERYLVKIDPVTGEVTQLSSSSIFEWYQTDGGSTIDPFTGTYYIRSTDEQNNQRLYGIDLKTGEIKESPQLINADDVHQLVYAYSCLPDASFDFTNTCFSKETEFQVKDSLSTVRWEFGDLDSGVKNISTEYSPHHIFSDTGVYNVMLIAKGCYRSDTLIKKVKITLPDTNGVLVSDTLLCPNQTIYLKPNIKVDSLFWSIGSNEDSILVNSNDNYILNYFNNNCHYSDSVSVEYVLFSRLLNDTTLCQGEHLLLQLNENHEEYEWLDGSTESSYLVSKAGKYTVTMKNGSCQKKDSIIVKYINLPELSLDTILCPSESIAIDAFYDNETIYKWSDGSIDSKNELGEPGSYFLNTQKNNCTKHSVFNITRFDVPRFENDTSFCKGDSLTLDFSHYRGRFLWSLGTTEKAVNIQSSQAVWLEYQDDNCTSYDTINIHEVIPEVFLIDTVYQCERNEVDIDVSSLIDDFLWSDGSNDNIYTITDENIVWIKTKIDNCSIVDTIVITRVLFDDVPKDTLLCSLNDFSWGNSNPNISQYILDSSEDDFKKIIFRKEKTCERIDTVNITVPNFPQLPEDTIVCSSGMNFLSIKDDAIKSIWQDSFVGETYLITEEGVVTVSMEKDKCIKQDAIFITFKNCDINLNFTNAFTPNNDGINDFFLPMESSHAINAKIIIYNRWGNVLYRSNNMLIGWDGTYNGNDCVSATYYWTLEYSLQETEVLKSGTVTLLR